MKFSAYVVGFKPTEKEVQEIIDIKIFGELPLAGALSDFSFIRFVSRPKPPLSWLW
jgi:hypothetical protein